MSDYPRRLDFWKGVRAGGPVAIGYIPIAVTFGLLARSLNIPNHISILMSMIIYAGSSQFIGINLMVLGVSYTEIIITTFFLNLRHFLMSATLAQKIDKKLLKPWRALLAFGVTDETFTVGILQPEKELSKYFVLGLNTSAFISWNIGTLLGVFFAPSLPLVLKESMGIALYAMFIGLLIPHMKKSKFVLLISLLAVVINSLIYWIPFFAGLSSGWGIIISTAISAAVGAKYYPAEEE